MRRPSRGARALLTLLVAAVVACSDAGPSGAPDPVGSPCSPDVLTDPSNCGVCGNVCAVGAACLAGTCACPAFAPEVCAGSCVSLGTPYNCGACGVTCSAGALCSNGACACPSAETECDGTCTDLHVDKLNCGECGKGCTVTCNAGTCLSAEQISIGWAHTCARMTDGTVRCWGNNDFGQLGDGTTSPRATPWPVADLTTAVEVAMGGNNTKGGHSCARLVDGSVSCWGSNYEGKLGDGTTEMRKKPTPVPGLSGASALAVGDAHSCAVVGGGKVLCWGYNYKGQLGDGTIVSSLQPIEVSGLTGVTDIGLGAEHTCALHADGAVWCWGDNPYGQLGTGDNTSSPLPVAVSGLSGAVQIAIGSTHSCARLGDGTMKCWGSNSFGEIGDGTSGGAANKLLATAVPGLAGIVDISAGFGVTCARLDNGTLHCWGNNEQGQLGNGTKDNAASPLAMSLAEVTQVDAGERHACAALQNGTVWCWGENFFGQLGNGANVESLSPVLTVGW